MSSGTGSTRPLRTRWRSSLAASWGTRRPRPLSCHSEVSFGCRLGDKHAYLGGKRKPELHRHAVRRLVIFPHPGKRLAREVLDTVQGIGQCPRQPPQYLPAAVTYRSQILNLPGDLGKYRFPVTQRDLNEIRHNFAPLASRRSRLQRRRSTGRLPNPAGYHLRHGLPGNHAHRGSAALQLSGWHIR